MRLYGFLLRWWPKVKIIPPACMRCGGSGIDCVIESVACWSCNGTGNTQGRQFVLMRITPELARRIAMGEFRRFTP